MARPFTAGERSRLGLHYNVHVRASVQDVDGNWIALHSLGGRNWIRGVRWGGNPDDPVVSGTLTLFRGSGAASLAPLIETSAHNQTTGAYVPLLDFRTPLRFWTNVTAPGAAPLEADWKLQPHCVLDSVQWSAPGPLIPCTFRDIGALLQDTIIRDAAVDDSGDLAGREYGSEAGTAVEAVMQAILDDTLLDAAPTLYTPVSPGWLIRPFRQARGGSVMEALRALAAQIGWDVRYRFDGAGDFRLTFAEPPRSKAVADYTFAPSEYLPGANVTLSGDGVRTIWGVGYVDRETGRVRYVTVAAPDPVREKYGDIYAEVREGSSSNIDTEAEALAMATAAVADTQRPRAVKRFETLFFWPAEHDDLIGFDPAPELYTSAQTFGVARYEHLIEPEKARTTFEVAGAVSGGYATWHKRAGQGPQPDALRVPSPIYGDMTVAPSPDPATLPATWELPVELDAATRAVVVYATESETTPAPMPRADRGFEYIEVTRPEGYPERLPYPTRIEGDLTHGWYRKVRCVPWGYEGQRGLDHVDETPAVAAAYDIGGFSAFAVVREGTGALVTFTPEASTVPSGATVETVLYLNGQEFSRHATAVTSVTIESLSPSTAYTVGIQQRSGAHAGPLHQLTLSPGVTGLEWLAGSPDYFTDPSTGRPGARLQWADTTPGVVAHSVDRYVAPRFGTKGTPIDPASFTWVEDYYGIASPLYIPSAVGGETYRLRGINGLGETLSVSDPRTYYGPPS